MCTCGPYPLYWKAIAPWRPDNPDRIDTTREPGLAGWIPLPAPPNLPGAPGVRGRPGLPEIDGRYGPRGDPGPTGEAGPSVAPDDAVWADLCQGQIQEAITRSPEGEEVQWPVVLRATDPHPDDYLPPLQSLHHHGHHWQPGTLFLYTDQHGLECWRCTPEELTLRRQSRAKSARSAL